MNQSPNEAFLGLGTALSEVEDPLEIDLNRMQLGTLKEMLKDFFFSSIELMLPTSIKLLLLWIR